MKENVDKYKWNKLSHQMFIIAALAFGVKSVTPKQILSVLHDKEPELTREKVGSHLQKFRILLAKQAGVEIYKLENWMMPEGWDLDDFRHISDSWKQPGF